ncbi:hypothetical protein BDN70DRAFT_997818 [Pholiota conissans]|uniref:Uncharacterized protein n=1 Tax=Pholiota conissans TaxID=109636 RepID=A0A9P5YQ97_9AGAR|nr:hypothetical protein BDN70DRAFT_997818 [Pholiota conissans]
MPSLDSYDILLDLTNDMRDPISIQPLRDYGQASSSTILLHPTESLTLILESGVSYQYALKVHTNVANVTARSWGDITCSASQLFTGSSTDSLSSNVTQVVNGVIVDRLWRDHRFSVWNDA